jgi:methionyl aminopeptidase
VALWDRIEIKTPEQIELMAIAGGLVGRTLELLREAAVPGTTLAALDALAEEHIRSHRGIPSFKGYGRPPFPASICASVNEVVVHGIPDDRVLRDGDLLSIDCGAIVDGWHGDAAITVAVGEVAAEAVALSEACRVALDAGIAAVRTGGRVADIGAAVEQAVAEAGPYAILDGYGGHGIGTSMHMEPHVPNVAHGGRSPRLREGMVLAIEPMLTLGAEDSTVLADGWSVVTSDGSWAAHWEHSVAVTPDGPRILTLPYA